MPSPSPRAAVYTPPAQPDFFVQTPVSVVRCRTLTPVQKTTYDVLCSYADATDTAYLGLARLAAEVGCSERTVRDAVHMLAAAGLVTVRRRGQGLTNLYHLTRIPLRTPRSTQRQVCRSRTADPAVLKRHLVPLSEIFGERSSRARSTTNRRGW